MSFALELFVCSAFGFEFLFILRESRKSYAKQNNKVYNCQFFQHKIFPKFNKITSNSLTKTESNHHLHFARRPYGGVCIRFSVCPFLPSKSRRKADDESHR